MIKFKTYNVIRPVSQEVVADSFKNLEDREIIFVAPEFSKAQVEREVLSYKAGKSRGEGKINIGEHDKEYFYRDEKIDWDML